MDYQSDFDGGRITNYFKSDSFDDDIFNSSFNVHQIKKEMKQEFYDVYIQNELFYKEKFNKLNKIIDDKNKHMTILLDTLNKTSGIAQQLQEENNKLKQIINDLNNCTLSKNTR